MNLLTRRIDEKAREVLDSYALLPSVPASRRPGTPEAGGDLKGLCFFEPHEMGRLLMTRLHGGNTLFSVYPPLELACRLTGGAVEITWKANPANDELIRKLKNNPLLTFGYRIYRWSAGVSKKPEIIATLPHNRTRFVDKTIGPVGIRYFYSVVATLEGLVGKEKTLIGSGRSKVETIDCPDRFTLRLVGGDAEKVNVEVTVQQKGLPVSQTFRVGEGEPIGRPHEIPGRGTVDFSTGLVLKEILVREEDREETVEHPVFNADGTRSVDGATGKPLFREEKVIRKYKVISIECLDPYGRKRMVEEG